MRNTRRETWAVIADNSKSTYLVSSKGRCKRIIKSDKTEIVSDGVRLDTQPTYLHFYNDYVHRLVAKAFIPNPHNYEQVDHINNDRTDNRVANLRWMPRQRNNQRKHAQKLRSQNATHTDHTDEMLRGERTVDGKTEVKFFKNGTAAAREIGCSTVLVYRAANPSDFAKRACGWKLEWVPFIDVKVEEN